MRISLPILAAGSNEWIIYAMGGVLVVYMVVRPLMRKKKDPLEKMPQFGLSQQRGAERDMQNLLVELSELARQVTGQLDTRSAKLDALIHEADAKIAELKRLIDQQRTGAGAAETEAGIEAPHEVEDPAERYVRQLAVGERTSRTAPGPSVPTSESRHQDVYGLSDAGKSAQEIAQQLGRPKGEVELILALRSR